MPTAMTAEQLATLTPEEKRIAIAEALGWKWCEFRYVGRSACPEEGRRRVYFTEPKDQNNHRDAQFIGHSVKPENVLPHEYGGVPEFTTSLDACAAMEALIPRELQNLYIQTLMRLIASSSSSHWDVCHASTIKRCDAFLLTLP